MAWSYKRLHHLLLDRGIKRPDFIRESGISPTIYIKLQNDEPITMTSLGKICQALHCKVEDIVEWIQDD